MDDWLIEPIVNHDRGEFRCGESSLDDFLLRLVSQYEKRKLGRTYVAIRPGSSKVLGYYTLSSGSIAFEKVPKDKSKKLPKHPVPVALLGRIAVDLKSQGQNLGQWLLMDALFRCLHLSKILGIHAVAVAALNEKAKNFYEKFGFQALENDPLELFLPIATIEKGFGFSLKK